MSLVPPFAVDVFLDTRVAFVAARDEGVRRGTLACAIMDDSYAEPIDDVATTMPRVWHIALAVRQCDWIAQIPSPPRQGDKFVSPLSGKICALYSLDALDDMWVVNAREIPRKKGEVLC